MNKVAFGILIVLLVTSCSSELQNIATPSTTIFSHPTLPRVPSSEPASTSTIVVSFPSATKALTLTPNPILLTQKAVVSSCAASERSWYTKHLSGTYFTNEQWEAVVCSDDGIYTKIWNTPLGLTWKVPLLTNDRVYENDVHIEEQWYWVPYLWSENGIYLYMKPVCLCFIDSPWLIYSSGFGLSRLDLSAGQFDIWFKPSGITSYSFAFTEDGNIFAFSPEQLPEMIKIRDLESGNEQLLGFKDKYSILEYRFTPDNSRLVIFTEEYESDSSKSGFSVFVYYLKTEILKKLLDKNNLNFSLPTETHIEPRIFISEVTNDLLTLNDVWDENDFQLNLWTGELVQVK